MLSAGWAGLGNSCPGRFCTFRLLLKSGALVTRPKQNCTIEFDCVFPLFAGVPSGSMASGSPCGAPARDVGERSGRSQPDDIERFARKRRPKIWHSPHGLFVPQAQQIWSSPNRLQSSASKTVSPAPSCSLSHCKQSLAWPWYQRPYNCVHTLCSRVASTPGKHGQGDRWD